MNNFISTCRKRRVSLAISGGATSALQQAHKLLAEAQAVSTNMFDKSQAYNQALIIAGYGGLFALLATTKSVMPRPYLSVAAFAIGLSLFVFMLHLILSMFVMSLTMLRTASKQLDSARSLNQAIGANTDDIEKALVQLRRHGIVWFSFWLISVLAGFTGAGIMMFFYFRDILSLW